VSRECKDLISKLLEKDPDKRISGTEAIKHPWFELKEQQHEDKKLTTVVAERIRRYQRQDTLQREALHVLMRTIDQDDPEVIRLRQVFD